MSITDSNEGWRTIELRAKLHEAGQVHCEPVPAPTTAQQLVWSQDGLARAKASIHRKNAAISTAIMLLSIGEHGRAQEVLNRALVDL